MADISKIKLPSGNEYDIKDAVARAAITGGMLAFIGKPSKLYSGDSGTTEVLPANFEDGNTTVKRVKLDGAVNIRGTSYASGDVYTVQTGDTMIVGDAEYVAVVSTSNNTTTVKWNEFGSTSTLGALAFKNSGSVTIDGVSVEGGDGSITSWDTASVSVDAPTGGTPSANAYTPAGSVSKPTLTKGTVTSTGNFTPSGSVSFSGTSNKTATVSPAQSGDATYTPAGTITQPTISVSSAGGTTTIKNPTSKTVVQSVQAYNPLSGNETAPTGAVEYWSVSNETLTLKGIKAPTGDSITTENKTVKTGDASYTASGAAFSGTGVRLVTGNIPVPSGATFSGDSGSVSVTTTGAVTDVAAASFTGTAVELHYQKPSAVAIGISVPAQTVSVDFS